jgi:hypothetical protein
MMESDTQTTTQRVTANLTRHSEGFKEKWRVQQQILSRRDQRQRDSIRAAGIVRKPTPSVALPPTVAPVTPEPAVTSQTAAIPQPAVTPHTAVTFQATDSPEPAVSSYLAALRQMLAEVKKAAPIKAKEAEEIKNILSELAAYNTELLNETSGTHDGRQSAMYTLAQPAVNNDGEAIDEAVEAPVDQDLMEILDNIG